MYDKNKAHLPDDFTEIVIDGGCHAYFGMYSAQDGDGYAVFERRRSVNVITASAKASTTQGRTQCSSPV